MRLLPILLSLCLLAACGGPAITEIVIHGNDQMQYVMVQPKSEKTEFSV